MSTTDDQPPARDPVDVDRARLRRTWRIAGWGATLGVALGLLAGVLGASGRAGMAILLLVAALGCALGAGYGTLTMIVDEWREQFVSRRRILGVAGLAALTVVLMFMALAAG